MSERIARFLTSLSQDPYKLDSFLDDPGPLLAASDLTPEERDVLRSGDPEKIRASLGELGVLATSTSSTVTYPTDRPHKPGGGGNNNPGDGNNNPGGGGNNNPGNP